MKTKIKRITAVLLTALMLFSLCQAGFAVNVVTDFAERELKPITQEDMLHTRGQNIINQKGEKVTLRGVNLGAWLIWEDWLNPYTDGSGGESTLDNYTVLTALEERFGRERAYELMNTYYDNFITENDLDIIASMGFNCVRLPFWFRNFYYDDKGTKILNDKGEWDFSLLERAVELCAERGLYVILDMHGAVGYQGDASHSGKKGSCGLYDRTQQGEEYRRLTSELWQGIAAHFKGNPAVAMYDLLNEPMCDCNATEITRRVNNEYIYSMLYDAVRQVDGEHIITMECIWTAAALPHAWIKGWSNVVYQMHFYQNSDFIFNLFVAFTRLYFIDVPLIMGEFYPLEKTTWKNCFNTMEKCNVNWLLWTYKASNEWMTGCDWCLICNRANSMDRVDPFSDSFEEIAGKWGSRMRTENTFESSGHYENNVKMWLE